MMGVFGLAAGLLAAIGIYGVISYTVTQRTHEIGVRMALGADSRSVLRLVVGQGMLLAMAGSAAGIAGAFALTRSLSAVLYEVSTTDAMTFVAMPALVLIVALIASFVPARRAARVSPLVAIRNE
jgi:putative ABC transport system permease protein